MTIVEADTNERLYRRQSRFTGKLFKMCKKYKVVIILVAHPRKTVTTTFQNDDVSGASEIANKGDVILNYERLGKEDSEIEEAPENVRWISVTKNRTGNGKLGKVKVDYSPDSKRIVQHGTDFDRNYFKDNDFIDMTQEDQLELPF